MMTEEFVKELNKANDKLDFAHIDNIIKKSLSPKGENFQGFTNLIIVMEEFAECQKEVSKHLRYKGDYHRLLEETADALIGIRYIQTICDISDQELIRAVNVKIKRLAERLKSKEWLKREVESQERSNK